MQVRVKLMGVLKAQTPEGGALELSDAATIADALTALDIPRNRVHAVSINGTFERDLTRPLQSDDEMMVLAPVGGG